MKKNYIESELSLFESALSTSLNWKLYKKVNILDIKLDLKKYPNKPNWNDILYISENFDKSRWDPIRVNSDYKLLDGQHRFLIARNILNLKYIDVIIDNENYA